MQSGGFRISDGSEVVVLPTLYGKSYELENLRLAHRVNESELLALLNGEAVYPAAREGRQFLGIAAADPRRAETLLRSFVDEWIDSSRDDDGTERPASRNLRNGEDSPARMAIYEYSSTLRLVVDYGGAIVLYGEAPRLPYTLRPAVYGIGGDGPDDYLTHEQSANAYFASLMLSPLARRIAKCRAPECGRYFVIGHPGHSYIGGTHCPLHDGERVKESRKRLTATARRNAREELYAACLERFADKLRKRDWSNKNALLISMAEELSVVIAHSPTLQKAYPKGIKPAWFKRKQNREGIAALLSGSAKRNRGKAQTGVSHA